MPNEWSVEIGSERFSVTVRPSGQGGAVVYEVDRISTKRERIGEIREGADGVCRPAAFHDESAKRTLETIIPLIHKKFHSVTRRLPKPERS